MTDWQPTEPTSDDFSFVNISVYIPKCEYEEDEDID